MSGPGRPAPPITLVVPGGEVPAELLDAGPPARPPLPGRLRGLLLVVTATLGAGVMVAVDQSAATRPALAPVSASPPFLGVSARVDLVAERSGSAVLDLVLTMAPGQSSLVALDQQPAPQLVLQDVTAPGLTVRLTRRRAPLLLDYVGRFASRTERELHLTAEVVVGDCSSQEDGPRPISLRVRMSGGPVGTVRASEGLEVVRALDDLVRRSCR